MTVTRKILLLAGTICSGVFFSHCHALVVVQVEKPAASAPAEAAPAPDQKVNQGTMVLGIYTVSPAVEVDCPAPTVQVRVVRNAWDNLIHFFIGPFYSTKTVEIFCKSG